MPNWLQTALVLVALVTVAVLLWFWARIKDVEQDLDDLEKLHPWLWDTRMPPPWAAGAGSVQEPLEATRIDQRDLADVTTEDDPGGWVPVRPLDAGADRALDTRPEPSAHLVATETLDDLLLPLAANRRAVRVKAADLAAIPFRPNELGWPDLEPPEEEPPAPDPLDDETAPEPEPVELVEPKRYTFYRKPASRVIHADSRCMTRDRLNTVFAQNMTLAEVSSFAQELGCWPCRRCRPWGFGD
jgi:hypothetical protein